ncbi:hypothetical protein KIN20_010241 [Parelaphostrongylus tenuis]|uniref:Uncharacterized protein n=1 Tax=Parelaphostrongylus tenuis TaxID=148309 RepID=A0AAD5MB45_PARTN|nr:hypothetical protein KIN20_010241 [Parelaphostrongylus tenuis]
MCPSNWDVIKVKNHAILSVGPPTQLMIGLTLNIDGSLDIRSSDHLFINPERQLLGFFLESEMAINFEKIPTEVIWPTVG